MNRGLQKKYLFGNLLPFIGDLCAVNNHLKLDNDIYPSELELQKESISTPEPSFLELSSVI